MIELIIEPTKDGRYRALLDGRQLAEGREPFFVAARRLILEGVSREATSACGTPAARRCRSSPASGPPPV